VMLFLNQLLFQISQQGVCCAHQIRAEMSEDKIQALLRAC
jgi:hypothetical protein